MIDEKSEDSRDYLKCEPRDKLSELIKIRALMTKKTQFEPISNKMRFESCESDRNTVLIEIDTCVAGKPIRETLLWPREEKDVRNVKFFAVELLADIFGHDFINVDPRETECKFLETTFFNFIDL